MYHIAICDDEKEFIREITNLLRRYEKESGKKFRITEFCDGSDLLKGYQTDTDLIFMDMQMPVMDGCAATGCIRKSVRWMMPSACSS